MLKVFLPLSCLNSPSNAMVPYVWEVLNGVGVDGVGGIFPFFTFLFLFFLRFFLPLFFVSLFFFLFCLRFSSFFFGILRFSLILPRGQGQTTAIYCKNGQFDSDPVCTDPVQDFPICGNRGKEAEILLEEDNRSSRDLERTSPTFRSLQIPIANFKGLVPPPPRLSRFI